MAEPMSNLEVSKRFTSIAENTPHTPVTMGGLEANRWAKEEILRLSRRFSLSLLQDDDTLMLVTTAGTGISLYAVPTARVDIAAPPSPLLACVRKNYDAVPGIQTNDLIMLIRASTFGHATLAEDGIVAQYCDLEYQNVHQEPYRQGSRTMEEIDRRFEEGSICYHPITGDLVQLVVDPQVQYIPDIALGVYGDDNQPIFT